MVLMDVVTNEHVDCKIWFLDPSFSNHTTGQKALLVDWGESKKRKVKHADNILLQAKGTSNIVIQKMNIQKAMIKDVLYVPRMKCNTLSVRQVIKRGFEVVMKDGSLELFDTKTNL